MNPQLSVSTDKTLYESDFYLWLATTAQLLRNGNFSGIDLDNLIEEIEGMARKEKQALKSNLRILLMHLLKWKYQTDKRTNSWRSTIREHRKRLKDAFADSPSLKPYYLEIFADGYQDARELASDETGLSLDTFAVDSPFTHEETLNEDYLPD
jgi:predicted DNA-binding ribbon-helix-helix protein